tara:strand:+ start:753 stop:1307 length:555 start_codon:yes stop_codon:yes gene_type:complete
MKKLKMNKLYLYAIEGDCSARGMSDWAEILPLKNNEEVELAKKYIRNDMECDFIHAEVDIFFNKPSPEQRKLLHDFYEEEYEIYSALKKRKVFEHKYHRRTTWEIIPESRIDEIREQEEKERKQREREANEKQQKEETMKAEEWFDKHVEVIGSDNKTNEYMSKELKKRFIEDNEKRKKGVNDE